jgi:hypothetical protein
MQSYRVSNIIKLLAAHFFQTLSLCRKLFIDFDDFLGHLLMRFFFAPDERKVRPGGDAFMTIGIKTYAEHNGLGRSLALFCWFSHAKNRSLVFEIQSKIFAKMSHAGTVSCFPLSDGPRLSRNGIAMAAHSVGET